MAHNADSDEEHLLQRPASISKDPPKARSASHGYELEDIDVSDIGSHKGSISSLYPPSYRSVPTGGDLEKDIDSIHSGYAKGCKTRSSTFSTISSRSKPAVKDGWARFLRWFLRSGTHGSHLEIKKTNRSKVHPSYNGWRGGCLAAAFAAGLVFLINIIFTIWAGETSQSGIGIGSLYEGSCGTVHTADSWLHIAINAMGTCLLGASNYTMQCLSSPTRREIDDAHAVGQYRDIGLPSLRNLSGWKKKLLFGLLVCSTVPLHFLWNSAIFTTTNELDYTVSLVTPNFLDRSPVDCSQNVSYVYYTGQNENAYDYFPMPLAYNNLSTGFGSYQNSNTSFPQSEFCSLANQLRSNATQNNLRRLSNKECITTYGQGNTFMKEFGNVLVVTKAQPQNSSTTMLLQFKYNYYTSNYTGNNWVCGPDYLISHNNKCNYKDLSANADSWSLGPMAPAPGNFYQIAQTQEYEIDYCLSQPTDAGGKCQLQYSLVIMISVLIANAVKFACILSLLWTQYEPVLATVGDGIASFLERPDPITVERPFLSRNKARKFELAAKRAPVRWQKPKKVLRWWHAPSWARWTITLVLCIIAIIVTIFLLADGNGNVRGNTYPPVSPYSLGFGTYNQAATLGLFGGGDATTDAASFSSNSLLISMVAVANLPQVIVSTLYFAYNTVYTSMVSAHEYSRFTTTPKSLRTTDPRGLQRSTYWLSLPWTYGLPLAISSSFLHYLISQSLFISRTEILDPYGFTEPNSYMVVAYSPLAILLALLFGTGMVVGMVVNGARKLGGGVLVGNNSLAIAATCQRPEWERGAELGKVRWGAVWHEERDKGVPGHCCFSGMESIEAPREGDMYL